MRVLVVTETDSFCGPMAAAFLRDYFVSTEVVSAGRNPSASVAPILVGVMKECMVDLDGYVPRALDTIEMKDFDAVYDCPELSCPSSWDECRRIRDYIKNESFLYYKSLRGMLLEPQR